MPTISIYVSDFSLKSLSIPKSTLVRLVNISLQKARFIADIEKKYELGQNQFKKYNLQLFPVLLLYYMLYFVQY